MTVPLEINNLSKHYGKRAAVEGLNLRVKAGEIRGFLGPNGAGKSTTLRTVLGLIKPTSGSVKLWGTEVWPGRRQVLGRVGALVEGPAFYDYLSARENLRLLAKLSGGASAREIDEALALVGLSGRAKDRVGTFSHGMKQRLALAQALVPKPELVILDEPTSGLDPQGMAHIRQVLKRLAKERAVTLLISSHLLYEVQQLCTDVTVINQGKVVLEGRVEELLSEGRQYVKLVTGDNERARAVVEEAFEGITISAETKGELVLGLTAEHIPELVRRLVAAEIDVQTVAPVEETMEAIFIRAIGADGYGELAGS